MFQTTNQSFFPTYLPYPGYLPASRSWRKTHPDPWVQIRRYQNTRRTPGEPKKSDPSPSSRLSSNWSGRSPEPAFWFCGYVETMLGKIIFHTSSKGTSTSLFGNLGYWYYFLNSSWGAEKLILATNVAFSLGTYLRNLSVLPHWMTSGSRHEVEWFVTPVWATRVL